MNSRQEKLLSIVEVLLQTAQRELAKLRLELAGELVSVPKVKKAPSASESGTIFANWFEKLLPEGTRITPQMKLKWAQTFDNLRALGHDRHDIIEVCKWARADSFWSRNFLSASKLMRKDPDGTLYYDKFHNQMERSPNREAGLFEHSETMKAREL